MAIEACYPQAFCFVAMFLYHSILFILLSHLLFHLRVATHTHRERGGGNSFKLGSIRCVVSKPTRNQVSCRHSTRGGEEKERSRASLAILCNTCHRQKQRRRVTKTEVMHGTAEGGVRVLGVYVLPSLLKNMR